VGMTIGAERISEQYGGPLGVAEAVLEGRMDSYDQKFVWEICPKNSPMWEAAKIRLEIRLKLRMNVRDVHLTASDREIAEAPKPLQLSPKKGELR